MRPPVTKVKGLLDRLKAETQHALEGQKQTTSRAGGTDFDIDRGEMKIMIKEALLDISKGHVEVFFDGKPVDSVYSVDGIIDDEPELKKIQLTFAVKKVFFEV